MSEFILLFLLVNREPGAFNKVDLPEYLSCNSTQKIEKKESVTNPLRLFLLASIRLYQHTFSIAQGDVCTFVPSCSHFGYEAIKKFGLLKGLLLTSDRLQRCHFAAWKYLNTYYTLKVDSLRGPKLFDPVSRYE